MSIIDDIRSAGYTIEKGYTPVIGPAENRTTNLPFLLLFFGEEKRGVIPKLNQEIVFGGGRHFASRDEAASSGALILRAPDIYKAFYDLNEEEMCFFEHGFGLRSWTFLQSVMDKIGLLRMDVKVDSTCKGNPHDLPENSPALCRYYGDAGLCTAYYNKIGDEWLVEIEKRYVLDDYVVEKYYFSHQPTPELLCEALDVRRACNLLKDRRSETYTCFVCRRKLHWLDCSADSFHSKVNRLEEECCGH